jgi:ABC-type phosphate transport system auxiliary subunit
MFRPYLLLAAVLALIGAFVGGYLRGYHVGGDEGKVAALQQQNEALLAQVAAQQQILNDLREQARKSDIALNEAANRADAIQADAELLQKEVTDYEMQLDAQKEPASRCALSSRDVQRLRDIAASPHGVRPSPPAAAP